jgi:hypothetical protein
MNTKWITVGLAFAMLAIPPAAMAGHGNGNGNGHDSYPGFPDAATYGLCTAYENNENGRENGQAGEAPPFQSLEDRADENNQTVEEYCEENGQHPGQGDGGSGDDNRSERAEGR